MDIKKCLAASLGICGTIVGVGFASGREVYSFFLKHGYLSLLFCLLAGLLFGGIAYLVFSLHAESKAVQKRWFNVVLFVCQIAIASAMFAGLRELLSVMAIGAGKAYIICVCVAMAVFIFLLLAKRGVYVANSVLSCLMLGIILVVLIIGSAFKMFNVANVGVVGFRLLYLPVLYAGMNIFTAYPLLVETAQTLKSKKERVLASCLIAGLVGLCLTLVCACLLMFGNGLASGSLAMVVVAIYVLGGIGGVYVWILGFSVVSTMVSTVYGGALLIKGKLGYPLAVFVSVCLALVLSLVGFARIIDVVYPLIGLVCLATLLSLARGQGVIKVSKNVNTINASAFQKTQNH